uniref:RRM domain-containing protein n=1 Tax=Ananas comosus var. bracteatus TaxID=296719 RepID=A0A6V7QGN2_ANACO|nr:unnamed protein product [Ananas comosus var. bracteatus]
MSRSTATENPPEFICEPQQVVPSARRSPCSTRPPSRSSASPSTPPSPRSPRPRRGRRRRSLLEADSRSIRGLLLQPFTKSQLVDLLFSAAAARPDLMDHIRAVARSNPRHRKVFVDQLPPGTTPAALAAALHASFGPGSVECALVAPTAAAPSSSSAASPTPAARYSPRSARASSAPAPASSTPSTSFPRPPAAPAEPSSRGPAWAGAWVSSTDGRRTPAPSAAYVVYEDAAAADAALADNPKVVAGNLVFCERVFTSSIHSRIPRRRISCRCRPAATLHGGGASRKPEEREGSNPRRRLDFDCEEGGPCN